MNKSADFVESKLALYLIVIRNTELFLLNFLVYASTNEYLSSGHMI